jgi:two-component system nitrogen regulation response regulator NtrX
MIMVVDDEQGVRDSIKVILGDEGYSVVEAATGEEALASVPREKPDGVLLDIWMPGMDGLETLEGLKQRDSDLPVVIMSGHGNIDTAVRATKLGAYDFLEKPLSMDRLTLVLRNALSQRFLVEENRTLKDAAQGHQSLSGAAPAIREILTQVNMVAPTVASVLVTGENGTGKELLARSIHRASGRSGEAFVAVNCAAIPENLIESELFGHEKGAFTGAATRKVGKFDLAHKGTLFLDEIGDMSLATQAKILRVLEERVFQRVGGNRDIEVDVRVIAATNKELTSEISDGNFREDLLFRLNVFQFHLPPLRERREDIPGLLADFLEEYSSLYGKQGIGISLSAEGALVNYGWPGNIRELRNVVERLVIIAGDGDIDTVHLPVAIRGGEPAVTPAGSPLQVTDYREAREQFEKGFFAARLEANGWNISQTAREVGLERSNLHRKVRQLGLKSPEKGKGA